MASKPKPLQKPGTNEARATPEPRTESYTRFKPPSQRIDHAVVGGRSAPPSHAPSTLPPAPFTSEADVPGHEGWLESHMGVAANILCFEQSLQPDDENGKLGTLAGKVGDVRDALYELYCDAADARMEKLTAAQGTLSMYIGGLYAWCDRIVDALLVQSMDARGVTLNLTGVRARAVTDARLFDDETRARIRAEVRALGIDFLSPVEPLRNLPKDVEQLFVAATALRDELTT